jgi:hypothetical protein
VERTKEKERKKIVSIIDMQLACKDVEGGGEPTDRNHRSRVRSLMRQLESPPSNFRKNILSRAFADALRIVIVVKKKLNLFIVG